MKIKTFAPFLVLGFYLIKTSLEYLQTYWIGVVGDGICRDIRQAQERAYAAVDAIDWPGGFCRRDIGWRAVERETEPSEPAGSAAPLQ